MTAIAVFIAARSLIDREILNVFALKTNPSNPTVLFLRTTA